PLGLVDDVLHLVSPVGRLRLVVVALVVVASLGVVFPAPLVVLPTALVLSEGRGAAGRQGQGSQETQGKRSHWILRRGKRGTRRGRAAAERLGTGVKGG